MNAILMGPLKFIIFFLSFLYVGSADSYAQYFNPKCRYTSIGFSLKASYFDGDIATPIRLVRPGFGFNLTRRIAPRLSFMTEVMWLRVMGDDYLSSNLQAPNKIQGYIRNLNFRNDIKELSFSCKFDLFPSTDHYRKRPIYNLYGLIGLSGFYHNPKAMIFKDSTLTKREWISLRPLETEGVKYSQLQIAVPLAVGIRYKISLHWDMEVEVAYRLTFTDFLDDVHGNYPDPSVLQNNLSRDLSNRTTESKSALSRDDRDLQYIQNELGFPIIGTGNTSYIQNYGPGAARGTKKGNDGYAIFGIRFLYAIPGKVNCPKFREFQ